MESLKSIGLFEHAKLTKRSICHVLDYRDVNIIILGITIS